MSSTESRLAAIERQLRFHRAVIAALLVALVALVGYGATEGVPDEIRARKFVVVNKKGRVVLLMEPLGDGAIVEFYDKKGEPNLTIHSNVFPNISLKNGSLRTIPDSPMKSI